MTKSSAWGDFLRVRAGLIRELRAEGQSCTQIARMLSMDPGQVWLINADHETDVPEDARRAVADHADAVKQVLG